MLTLQNPGTTDSIYDTVADQHLSGFSAAGLFDLTLVFVVSLAVMILLGVLEAKSFRENGGKLRRRYGVAFGLARAVAVAAILGAVAISVVNMTCLANAAEAARASYIETVQHWLAEDYGIELTGSDAAKIAFGDTELAVQLDGKLVGIELVDGVENTIQVKLVGGEVLQPSR